MPLALQLRFYQACPLLAIAGLLVSCDTPQKRGLRELSKIGIEPSGSALLEAVTHQDSKLAGWLLDVGVFTEQCDSSGKTPVRIAIENKDVDPKRVRQLIEDEMTMAANERMRRELGP